MISKTQAPFEN